MNALIFAGLPIALLALGTPIFIILLVAALSGVLVLGGVPLQTMHTTLFGSLDSFALLAVPLFIFAGEHHGAGGIAQRLIELIMTVIGGIRGSLALATIGAASAFGAMSGSSVACVAAIGKLMLPALRKERLWPQLPRQPDHGDGRDRRDHPAVDPDDHLCASPRSNR